MGKATNSIARKGSRGDFVPFHFPLAGCRGGAPAGAWGNAPTVPRTTGMPNALNKGAGSEASLPVTLRVLRRAPQAALSINSTLSRQMGATDQHGRRFSLDAGLFHCRRKTESVSYRNRKAPAAAGQSSLCAAGVVLCCLHLRLLELRIIQFRVEAALLQQLLVRAGFDDVAVAHDQNLVRVLDGGETVRNDERGTSLR